MNDKIDNTPTDVTRSDASDERKEKAAAEA